MWGLCKGVLGEFSDHAAKALWVFIHTVVSERAAVERNSGEVVSWPKSNLCSFNITYHLIYKLTSFRVIFQHYTLHRYSCIFPVHASRLSHSARKHRMLCSLLQLFLFTLGPGISKNFNNEKIHTCTWHTISPFLTLFTASMQGSGSSLSSWHLLQ